MKITKLTPMVIGLSLLSFGLVHARAHDPIQRLFTSSKYQFQNPSLKLLLAHKIDGAVIECKSSYAVYDPANNKRITSGITGKRCAIHPLSGGLVWGEEFPGVYQIKIVPEDIHGFIWINEVQYKGSVYIYQIGSSISLVQECDIEDCVKGCMSQQFALHGLEQETLSALAILTRTTLTHYLENPSSQYWNLTSDSIGYQGSGMICDIDESIKACILTNGMVLSWDEPNDNPFKVIPWTLDCGGKTADYKNIFDDCKSNVKSKFCMSLKPGSATWSAQVDLESFAAACDVSKIKKIKLNKDPESGRVQTVTWKSSNEEQTISWSEFVKLSKADLKSNLCDMRIENGKMYFDGKGSGLGVGLCVQSAERLAKQGLKANEILKHFFPEASLQLMEWQKR